MKERFVELTEKYVEEVISPEEENELMSIINTRVEYKIEFEDQKRIKEALKKMKLKNPSEEVWDSYWIKIYNRIERGFAWIIISIGFVILAGYAAIQFVEELLKDTKTPEIVKLGSAALIVGLLILLFSILREKFFAGKSDKYKEIQR
ncbi:MAG: hypothetical protein KJ799_17005 [Bacteroidetes bacterium]|nr:hypothetical protein [Bacteroidota bacterium]MBU2508397.1 hypothetical protein [Bacteroidota bacterium]